VADRVIHRGGELSFARGWRQDTSI
jgi:hypothetical protein